MLVENGSESSRYNLHQQYYPKWKESSPKTHCRIPIKHSKVQNRRDHGRLVVGARETKALLLVYTSFRRDVENILN